MAIKVGTGITTKQVAVAGSTTQVKRVIVGAPIRNVIASGTLANLTDVTLTGLTHNQILLYDSASDQWVNSSSLTPTGVTAGTYGSSIQIPQISVTSAGLIDSAKNISVASTLATVADSGTGSISLLDSSLSISGGSGITTSVSGNTITVTLDSAINSGQFGNLTLSGNTLASTTGGQIIIDPNPVGDSGDVIIKGNLQVDGTTTTINSTILTVNDKNIVLASGAADSISADGAGITVDGSNAAILYNDSSGTWDFNIPFGTSTNVLSNYTTSEIAEASNLYYTIARADSDARNAVSATGDLSYDPNTGVFSINVETEYTSANFDSDLDAAISNGTGISYNSTNNSLNIDSTGVIAGTYGSSTEIPVFTVNAQGQLDSAGSVTVAGVAGLTYDSSTGALSISTADGATFTDSINLNPFTTSNLTEGSNLYYTTARADSDARYSLTGSTGVTYVPSTGTISIGQSVGTSDNVTFNDLVLTGNLQVNGATTTVNTQTLEVTDNMIYMNAGESSGSPTAFVDVGWAANVNETGTYYHVGMFRDATDGVFKLYHEYLLEPDSTPQIDVNDSSFAFAPLKVGTFETTGLATIGGNLQVEQKTISLGNTGGSDSAGMIIENADARFYYKNATSRMHLNKPLNIQDSIGNGLFFKGTNILDAVTFVDGGTF